MKPLVIFDSQYGNTEMVAQAIGQSLKAKVQSVLDTSSSNLKNIDFLVVGSPTQGGRATVALQNFLNSLPANSLKDVQVAAFDTRFLESKLSWALKLLVRTIGYAAPKISRVLTDLGGQLIADPEGFIVTAKEGPLADGEITRAQNWLKKI